MNMARAAGWLCVWLALVQAGAAQGAEPAQAERVQRYLERHEAAAASLQSLEQRVNDEHERMVKARGQTKADEDRLMGLMLQVHELDKRQIEQLRLEMVNILGDQAPSGFKPESQLNVWSVLPHPGRASLDGLTYEDAAGNGSVVVAPITLFDDWLQSPRLASKPRPQAIAELLENRDLYMNTGQYWPWSTVASRLPVRTPAGAEQASALLMDDSSPLYYMPPSHIVVVVIDRDRLYIASRQIAAKLPGAEKCAKRHYELAHRDRFKEAQAGYRDCYTQLVRGRPEFAQATREAQAFIDRLRPPDAGR